VIVKRRLGIEIMDSKRKMSLVKPYLIKLSYGSLHELLHGLHSRPLEPDHPRLSPSYLPKPTPRSAYPVRKRRNYLPRKISYGNSVNASSGQCSVKSQIGGSRCVIPIRGSTPSS